MIKFKLITFLILILGLSSCFQAADNPRLSRSLKNSVGSGGSGDGSGDGITDTGSGIDNEEDEVVPKVELRHLIEPRVDDDSDTGQYKRKLTIPKNYNGFLYLAGINISTMSAENVKVRFNFGVDSQSKILDATIATAPGLIPQTNVEVLVIDMRTTPFEDVQLLYDLFDYNTYDFPGTGSDPGALGEPVSNNRDDGLFCRGVSLKDDPTFNGNLIEGCKDSDDICKYAYAKIVDKGLVLSGSPNIPIIPSEINVQSGDQGYYLDDDSLKLNRCLPDNPILTGSSYVYDDVTTFLTFEASELISNNTYIYRGPYRPINFANWEITSEALKGSYGLFGGIYDDNTNGEVDDDEVEYGYLGRLFPLYTKFDLLKGTEYLGSSTPDDEKTLQIMSSNSTSLFLDGCNERARTVHEITGEHIGSCNVTATIEILTVDDNGKEKVVDITDEVKLQLVKPAALNIEGDNVLLSSFQQCSSSSQCGGDSCCINKRCWSKAIVSQCVEDLPNFGNLETGESCTSDYQCSSFCCNNVDGRCAPHDTIGENPVYCSKASGQSCVAKEWCAKHPVTTCAVVKTGLDPLGNQTCALRCITVEVNGDCVSPDGKGVGQCIPPTQPDAPTYDPNDPNRCDEAITVDELIFAANNPDEIQRQ